MTHFARQLSLRYQSVGVYSTVFLAFPSPPVLFFFWTESSASKVQRQMQHGLTSSETGVA